MAALLAKSYCRERYPDAPPDYALLTQHSRDVAEACDTLAQEIGRLTLLNAGLDEDAFESFQLQLRANGWIQDLGKSKQSLSADGQRRSADQTITSSRDNLRIADVL